MIGGIHLVFDNGWHVPYFFRVSRRADVAFRYVKLIPRSQYLVRQAWFRQGSLGWRMDRRCVAGREEQPNRNGPMAKPHSLTDRFTVAYRNQVPMIHTLILQGVDRSEEHTSELQS